jgi:hypothetical protein
VEPTTQETGPASGVDEVHILWISALEEVVLGLVPGATGEPLVRRYLKIERM